MVYKAVLGYPRFSLITANEISFNWSNGKGREFFLKSRMCKLIESLRLPYFTEERPNSLLVFITVSDDEFVLLQCALPEGYTLVKQDA